VAADTVTINAGITVTVPSGYAAVCSTIDFTTGSGASSINLADSTASLAVSGAVTIERNGSAANTINVDGGTFSAASVALQATSSSSARTSQILISTGTATVAGNITSGGTYSQIIFSGAGTLNVGGTFLSGTTGTLTPATGTVNYNAAGAQTIGDYTYNNLTLSGGGVKTENAATVNGVLSMEGAATISSSPTYGAAAKLRYNTAIARTAGAEWITPFAATGGVLIDNTGTITLNAAKVFNASVPLTINSGAALNTSAANSYALTFGGDFANAGTFTANSSAITLASTAAAQSIAGFTTAGLVSMTKTSGTATFAGNVNGGGLTINGTGGTLSLGSGWTHTFTGTWTRTAGTLDGGSSTLNLGGAVSGTGGAFTASTGTVNYNAAVAQTIAAVTYNNLVFSGSGVKSMPAATAVDGNLSIGPAGSSATASIAAAQNLIVNSLTLGGTLQVSGTYGGSGSSAGHVLPAYFASTTGILTVGATRLVVTLPGQTFTSGTGNSGSVINQAAGTQFGITLTAVDANNNIDTSFSGLQTVSYTGPLNAPGGAAPSYTMSVTFTSGQATGVATTLVDAQTTAITASISGLPGVISSNLTVAPGAAAQLAFTTQPGGGTGGTAWGTQPAVTLRDANGNTVTGTAQNVTLAIQNNAGPGGVLSGTATVAVSTTTGVATFSGLSIDKIGTGYTLTATGSTVSTTLGVVVSSAFSVTAGTATKLAITSVNGGANPSAGTAFSVVVQSQDAGGNAANVTSSTTLSLSRNTGTGTLGGTTTGTIANGTSSITISGVTYTKAESGVVLTATRTSGMSLAAGNSSAFTVNPGAASKLVITSVNGGANPAAGTAFSVVVQSQDANSNVANVAGDTGLSLSRTSGTGTLGGTTTGTITAGTSSVTISGVTYTKAESGVVLTATRTSGDTLTAGVSSSFTVIAGAAAQLAFTTQPGGGTGGTAWTTQPVVTLRDANGNTVTGTVQNVTLAIQNNAGPGGVLSGTATVAVSTTTGVATFSGLSIDKIGTGYTLTATGSTVSTTPGVVVSSAFNVTAGTATKLAIITSPQTSPAGSSSGTITVQIQDAGANPVNQTGSARTVNLTTTSTGGVFRNTADNATITSVSIAVGANSASFLYRDTVADSPTITAATTSPTTLTSATQGETVSPLAASAYRITAASGTPTAGVADALTIRLVDQYTNVVTSFTGNKTLTFSGITASLAGNISTVGGVSLGTGTTVAFVNGISSPTVNLVAYDTGAATLAATDGTLSTTGTGGTGAALTVGVAAQSAYRITAASSTPTAGAADALTITAVDQYGNTVTSYTGNHSLTFSGLSTSPNGTVPTVTQRSGLGGGGINLGTATSIGFSSGVNNNGGTLVAYKAEGPVTLAVTDGTYTSAMPGGTGASLTVSGGALAGYAVTAATPQTRGTAFDVTVRAQDAGGNLLTTDSSTVVTMTSSTGDVQFDSNGDGTFGDNSKTLSSGTFTISTKDPVFESVTITATDATAKTGTSSAITVNPLSGDYRSQVATGTWGTAGTWQTYNGSTWATAGSAPTSSTTGQISVQNGNTVTVGTSVTAQNFVIVAGGTVSISSGITLTVNNGVANGVISGAGILKESGAGNLLDLNGNNTYSGGTVISGGTVAVTNITTSGTVHLGTDGITFDSGGTLLNTGPGAQSTSRAITLNTGGGVITMAGPTMTLTGTISGGGGLTSGGSDLILQPTTGNNSIGTITVNSGRLFVFNTGAINGSAVVVNNGATIDFGITGGASPANVMSFASGSCLANRVGTLTVSTANVTFPASGTMIFNQDDQVTTAITVNGAYPALAGALTIQLGGSNPTVGTVTLNGAIIGGGSLTKSSTGTLVLGAANSYSGGTTVSSSNLIVSASSSLGSGNVSVANGARLTLSNNTAIAASAGLLLNGSAVVTNSFTGTNTIAALSFDGGATFQAVGTWGNSGATHNDATRFQGAGRLKVVGGTTTTIALTAGANPSTYGDSLTFTATVSATTPGTGTLAGTVTFKDGTTTLGTGALNGSGVATLSTSTLSAGTHSAITAVYASSDGNFGASTGTLAGSQTVNKATPTIAWATPADITYGTALSGAQLNATASVPGGLAYSPLAGTVLNAGPSQALTVNFTPTDTGNYNNASATVYLNVNKATLTITAKDKNKPYGTTLTFAGTEFTQVGLVAGDSVTSVTLTSAGAAAGAAVGAYDIVAGVPTVGSGLANYKITYVKGTLTVVPGAGSKLAFTTGPVGTMAGTTLAGVVVQIQDADGNNVAQPGTAITLALNGGGALGGTTTHSTDANGHAAFNDLTITQSGSGKTLAASSPGLTSATSGAFGITPAAATSVRVETKGDGTGTVVPAQNVAINNPVTVYAITRDQYNNFVANVAADVWTLPTKTGGVVDGDLAPTPDRTGAVFTGQEPGTATIHATSGGLHATDSGTLTVIHLVQFTVGTTNSGPAQ
jgi:hypothetical protein